MAIVLYNTSLTYLIFDKTLLSDRRDIGKFRLYVNYLFSQDVMSVCNGGEQ
jgi:hypothetical protein